MMCECSESRFFNTRDGQKYYADDFGQRTDNAKNNVS